MIGVDLGTAPGAKGTWSGSSGVSSLPNSSRGSAVSVASSSPSRSKVVATFAAASNATTNDVTPLVASQNNTSAETAQSLDNQLRALDRFYQNKVKIHDYIIQKNFFGCSSQFPFFLNFSFV